MANSSNDSSDGCGQGAAPPVVRHPDVQRVADKIGERTRPDDVDTLPQTTQKSRVPRSV
jgi:hypothetical protein